MINRFIELDLPGKSRSYQRATGRATGLALLGFASHTNAGPLQGPGLGALVTGLLTEIQIPLADRYRIERELGRGGMSIVYLSEDLKHGRRVAIKVLRPELTATIAAGRFLREIQIASRLQHPAILPLFDSGEAAGRVFYVMPYVAGESLRARLQREKQLTLADALRIARDVAEGLAHAHEQGVVHRDIKPENILLTGGRAIIADFGIARALVEAGVDPITNSGIAVGTPGYMSPEQAGGNSRLDGRSDVYSLGCVLFEMLAGEPPFTGPTPQAVLARHMLERPPMLRVVRPTVPDTVEQAVHRALAKVPADRFATAGQFADALASTSEAAPPKPYTRLRRAAVGALAAFFVAALLWALWQRWSGPDGNPSRAELAPQRVAVLYLDDLTANNSLRHVARGLTEELIDMLGAVEALHVISPSGVRPYSGRSVPVDSIARALKIGSLVEGSITQAGDRLRVTVRLVNAVTGEQLSSTVLERPPGDLFELQEDLAGAVSRFLRERLGWEILLRQRRASTRSVAAWELLRRAMALREDADSLHQLGQIPQAARLASGADSLLARSEQRDPRWLDPIVLRGWLAKLQADLSSYEWALDDTASRQPTAAGRDEHWWIDHGLDHASRALRLDPNAPRALELRGYLRFRRGRDLPNDARQATALLDSAERDLQTALAKDPELASAWNSLSLVQTWKGDFAQASLSLDRALEADAYLMDATRTIAPLMLSALERGDVAQAKSLCQTGQEHFPRFPGLWECELMILQWTGRGPRDVARGWQLVGEVDRRDSSDILGSWAYRRLMVASILARTGLRDSARAVMQRARDSAPSPALLDGIELFEAYVHVLLNEPDAALDKLEALVQANPPIAPYVARTRWFEPLRGAPRFIGLTTPRDSTPR